MNDFTILVTGANGFVGQALCACMRERHMNFVPVMRRCTGAVPGSGVVRDIHSTTDWRSDLGKIDAVVHLAGRVHIVHDSSPDPLRDYRLANVDATLNLAAQCATAGVRRFIYLSSIKVNGELTTIRPFLASDEPAPIDPYGISKHEAEQGLRKLARETGMEVVIIRPPLVYGPRVKANFFQLMRWVRRGIPLPLASVDNRRSMVFVDNLVDLILRCITHTGAPGHTFFVSDGHDVSVSELVSSLASVMGRTPMLFPLPPHVLRLAASLTGKGAAVGRLLNSLQVDIENTREVLEWVPPYSFEVGIEKTVRHFLESDHAYRKS